MIRVTTITKIPAGKVRPILMPEFKELFDRRAAIHAKYQVSFDLNSYDIVKEPDGSQTDTQVVYYKTIEDLRRAIQEVTLFIKNNMYNSDGVFINHLGPHSEITRKYRVVDTETNEVITDWTELNLAQIPD